MFNYKKLAVAQVEAAGAVAALRLAKELYERIISDKDKEITRLKEHNDALRGKNSLMETILMPLSSRAGAAYQEAAIPREKPNFKTIVEDNPSEWRRYKQQHEADLDKEYLAEETK